MVLNEPPLGDSTIGAQFESHEYYISKYACKLKVKTFYTPQHLQSVPPYCNYTSPWNVIINFLYIFFLINIYIHFTSHVWNMFELILEELFILGC